MAVSVTSANVIYYIADVTVTVQMPFLDVIVCSFWHLFIIEAILFFIGCYNARKFW